MFSKFKFEAIESFFAGSALRSKIFSRLVRPRRLYQHSNWTIMDRYPAIFQGTKDYFGSSKALKMLSFGCSTGEEAFTLRTYFPSATIVGVDIDLNNLKICRDKNTDKNIHFMKSTPENLEDNGPYDAIFSMAVLQMSSKLTSTPPSSKAFYPFERFESQIIEFDSYLNLNGTIAIAETNYRFCDSELFKRYSVLKVDHEEPRYIPKYNEKSEFLKDEIYKDFLFVKNS